MKVYAQGRGGTTHWLILRLTNLARQQEARPLLAVFFKSSLDESRVGEYRGGDYAIIKIVKYFKEWAA